jgi:hypothetical protein
MRTKTAAGIAILLGLAAMPTWGQSQSITLGGTITDPSGAIVQRVKVQLVNVDTGEDWTATTNESGNYFLPLIKPGRYRLTAEAPGFKQYQQTGIELETGVPARADLRLEIGVVTESVTVEGTVPLLQGGTSAVGTVVNNRTIAKMPLADRRAAQLARLAGFVVLATPSAVVQSGPAFEMAGGRGGNTTWLIDGGNAQFVSLGTPGLLIDPPVESMQEFNVSVSNYAAELGRTGGGVVQITTRSGTNQLHGSAYEYFRHDKLDARNFFAAEEPTLRYNLFGASLGGPIRRNKAHFFFNYEGLRRNTPRTRILNIPEPAEIRGDFSRSPTIVRDPQAAGRPPFQGNTIPASRLDPVGARLAAAYPEPNVPGRPSGNGNFVRNHGTLQHSDTYVARVDYNHSDKDRLYGRLLVFDFRQHILPVFPTPGLDPFEASSDFSRYSPSATWLHHFAPAAINELRYTFSNSNHEAGQPGGLDLGLPDQIGLRGTNPRFPPQVNLGPRFQMLGIGGGNRDAPLRSGQLTDTVTYIRGSHALKFGYEWRPNTAENVMRGQAGGNFGFGEQATGNALASLLLGWVQQGSRNESLPGRYRSLTMSGFVQDDWKVNNRLTLNLGLRWDWDQPRWEQLGNRQNSFDRITINPVSGTPGVVTFSGRNGLSKFAHQHDWNNFGPRAGFAWRATDNWVIRGGGAIVYAGEYAAAFGGFGGAPTLGFSIQGNFASPDMGITPPFLLRNGLPAIQAPAEAALTPGFGAVPAGRQPTTQVGFFEPDRRTGYLETFNFNIQRRLTSNLLAEVGYLGTMGHKLVTIVPLTINQLRPELMGPGNRQNLRPFPQFTNVVVANPSVGNSNYHGMNLKIEKRYSRGLQFQANYTWSRFLDDVVALFELGAGSAFTNAYDRRGDRGLAGNHVSHRLIWSSVWELPAVNHPLWKRVLGGWSTGLIGELRTGPPYGVTELVNGTGASSPSQRPNVAGDPKITGSRSRGEQVERWFHTSAFAQPAPFTFGNAGRTVGYGPGAVILDLSILKDFRLAERHSLEFRTEMLNAMNHANFALQPQNLARGNAAFGRVTGLASGNQSRIIQLGLHYRF